MNTLSWILNDFFVPHSPEDIQAVKSFWGERKDILPSGVANCAVTHSPSNSNYSYVLI